MSSFFQALEEGYLPEEILKYISKAIPKMSEPIRKASKLGYTTNQILGFLSKNFDTEDRRGMSEPERQAANRRSDSQRIKYGLTMAAGAVVAPLAASVASNALSRVLPTGLKNLSGSMNPVVSSASAQPSLAGINSSPANGQTSPAGATASAPTLQMPQSTNQLINSAQQPPVSPSNITQPKEVQQPKGIINPKEYLEKKGILEQVNDSLKRGNKPEQVAAELGIKRTGRSRLDPELLSNIEAYAQETQAAPQKQKILEPEVQKLDVSKETPEIKEETKPISKNQTVASPQGVGEVKEIRNGKALVDVDGKLHKVDAEDLEGEPEEVKNAKFDFDLSDVPEDLRSAPLNEVYLPYDKRHVTVKYNAGLKPIHYIYFRKDGQSIPNDYINKIVQGVQLPVSSGKSFWGVWNADKSDSRGAANYEELVANSQEEGEKDNPEKEYWFIQEEALYEHPYMELKGKKELRELEKKFNEERKKRKKNPA